MSTSTSTTTPAIFAAQRVITARFGGHCYACGVATIGGEDTAALLSNGWQTFCRECLVPEMAVVRALEAAMALGDEDDDAVAAVVDLVATSLPQAVAAAIARRLAAADTAKAAGKPVAGEVPCGLHRTAGDDVSGPQVFMVQMNRAGTAAYAKQRVNGSWVYIGRGPLARLSAATLMSRADAEDLGIGKAWDNAASAEARADAASPVSFDGDVPVGYYAVASLGSRNDLDFYNVQGGPGEWDVKLVIGGKTDKAVGGKRAQAALEAILAAGPAEAGKLFADELEHCRFCNRHLTDKPSRDAGYGPDCARERGLPWG